MKLGFSFPVLACFDSSSSVLVSNLGFALFFLKDWHSKCMLVNISFNSWSLKLNFYFILFFIYLFFKQTECSILFASRYWTTYISGKTMLSFVIKTKGSFCNLLSWRKNNMGWNTFKLLFLKTYFVSDFQKFLWNTEISYGEISYNLCI